MISFITSSGSDGSGHETNQPATGQTEKAERSKSKSNPTIMELRLMEIEEAQKAQDLKVAKITESLAEAVALLNEIRQQRRATINPEATLPPGARPLEAPRTGVFPKLDPKP